MYTEEDLIRMIEMRIKPERLTGTLCRVRSRDLLMRAMIYLGEYDSDSYLSNPYCELSKDVYDAFSYYVFRIFVNYNNLYVPPFTVDEIQSIMDACKRFDYRVYLNEDRLTIYRR